MASEREPAEYFRPGEYILDEIAERGIDRLTFAALMDWDTATADAIFAGERKLLVSDCERLGRFFNTTTQTWLNLERAWRTRPLTPKAAP